MDPRSLLRTLAPAVVLIVLTGSACTDGDGPGVHGTPGAAGLRDPYFPKLGNGGYDVTHYDLVLRYDPKAGTLAGAATITARATQDLSAFNLDLHGLTVEGVTVDGTPAAANRAGNELTIRPRRDLDEGSTFRTVVRYAGTPQAITDPDGSREGWLRTADGAVALGEPAGSMAWFPGNHHPSDKATYDITVTVPEGVAAVSNGELRSQRPAADGGTIYAWHSGEPMASYLATLAVGPFDIRTSHPARAGVPVITAVDKSLVDASEELRARIPEVQAWAQRTFGPYPFSSTGAVVTRDPFASAEGAYALETQTRPFFPEGDFEETTLVHELAHQWYGNSVSPKTWGDMWLNEGFATYAEWLYDAEFEGKPVQQSFDDAFEDEGAWAFPPAEPPVEDLSGAPVYLRGAMVLHEVRRAVGDETFFALLKEWPQSHRHGNASTEDFTAFVEERSGKDLTELWDAWLYGDGRPEGV
ncbi:M1 family metallopeptidase [Streptomyces sp. NPDC059175]|uniref:M1 family metallopeptidase n=1 Tax=unclassified Streptomyces TaxID=2593676 RepID=UPI00369B38D0